MKASIIVTLSLFCSLFSQGSTITLSAPIPALGSKFSLEVQKFTPPIKISNGIASNAGERPEWFESFIVLNKSPLPPYGDFRAHASNEYVTEYGITEEEYKKLAAAPTPSTKPPDIYIWYSLKLKCDQGLYIFVVQSIGLPSKNPPTSTDLFLSLFKYIDSKWMAYPSKLSDPVLKIPWNQLSTVEQIILNQSAKVDDNTGKLQ